MRNRVTGSRVARLATVGADGRPHLVPITFVLIEQTLYSAVDRKPKTTTKLRRLDNIERNPSLAVLVDHYDEDWSTLWWCRLDGVGRVLRDGPEVADALRALTEKYPQYRETPPTGPVVAIRVTRWSGWSA